MDGGTFAGYDGNLIDSHSNSVMAINIVHSVLTLISKSVRFL